MSYICVRGAEHYYEWVRTPATSEKKPVMVFIHGWAGSARYWETTAQTLADTFDCLLYDMRGFGRSQIKARSEDFSPHPQARSEDFSPHPQARSEDFSPHPHSSDYHPDPTETNDSENHQVSVRDNDRSHPPQIEDNEASVTEELTYELEEYAKDLAALLDSLHLNRVYINAHSMGASVATFFLNLYPERVERAILTCSGIFEYDEKAFTDFHKFGGYVVKFRPRWLSRIPYMDKMFMARFLHRPLPSAVSRAFLEDFLTANYDAALNTILTSVSKKSAEVMPQEFAKLKVPTLLIAGEHDIIIPAEMGRQAAALNDVVEFAVIPNTAHFPMLEDPVTYFERVREFLGDI